MIVYEEVATTFTYPMTLQKFKVISPDPMNDLDANFYNAGLAAYGTSPLTYCSNGEPEIPPAVPPEVPPEEVPIGIPPTNPPEIGPEPNEVPGFPPQEVPQPPPESKG